MISPEASMQFIISQLDKELAEAHRKIADMERLRAAIRQEAIEEVMLVIKSPDVMEGGCIDMYVEDLERLIRARLSLPKDEAI